jgi:hypothetical protein
MTAPVMTSLARVPVAFWYSRASRSASTKKIRHQGARSRGFWRTIRSPSLTMPTTFPFSSTTGRPVTPCSTISWAALWIGVSGLTVMTSRVMISLIFIAFLLRAAPRPVPRRSEAGKWQRS